MCLYNDRPLRLSFNTWFKNGMMGSPGRWSDVNKGVPFWTELIQAERNHDDIEWLFTFIAQLNTIFRSFPQLACLFWVKVIPSLSASAHTRSPRWHVCMCVRGPVSTADWQIGLLEYEDSVNNDTFCSCRETKRCNTRALHPVWSECGICDIHKHGKWALF